MKTMSKYWRKLLSMSDSEADVNFGPWAQILMSMPMYWSSPS